MAAATPRAKEVTENLDRVGSGPELYSLERVAPSGVVTRAPVVRLRDQGLLVVNPPPDLSREGHQHIKRLSRPELVLVQGGGDGAAIDPFVRIHGESDALITSLAQSRCRKEIKAELKDLGWLRQFLPEHVTLLPPHGLVEQDLWLQVMTSRGTAWIVGDAFRFLSEYPSGLTGLLYRLKREKTGLVIPSSYLRSSVADVGAYRAWLFERIRESHPTVLVPTHGKIVHSADLPRTLKRVVEALT